MGKVAVTYLTTAYATLGLGLACREGREVVVEKETLATLIEDVVKDFLIELGAESYC